MSPGKPFEPGERVLLIDSKERRYLMTLASGQAVPLAHGDARARRPDR